MVWLPLSSQLDIQGIKLFTLFLVLVVSLGWTRGPAQRKIRVQVRLNSKAHPFLLQPEAWNCGLYIILLSCENAASDIHQK